MYFYLLLPLLPNIHYTLPPLFNVTQSNVIITKVCQVANILIGLYLLSSLLGNLLIIPNIEIMNLFSNWETISITT